MVKLLLLSALMGLLCVQALVSRPSSTVSQPKPRVAVKVAASDPFRFAKTHTKAKAKTLVHAKAHATAGKKFIGAAVGAVAGAVGGAMDAMGMGNMGRYPRNFNTYTIYDESEYGAYNERQQSQMETQMMIGTPHTPYGAGNNGPQPGASPPVGPRGSGRA